ncbi:hypothetical protein IT407_04250 [Candidatus Uhrbacteria bacterium]|nr:hypothetical protein [Candidatus Uhrbacteria bacterium]
MNEAPQKKKFETDHPVVIFVERLGKFITILFYSLWTWLWLSDFSLRVQSPLQMYLRNGLLVLHLSIALYMILRSGFAMAATATNVEVVHAIGDKRSKWELLEDRLLMIALAGAVCGTLFGIYYMTANQA